MQIYLDDLNQTTVNSDLGAGYYNLIAVIVVVLVVMKTVMGLFSKVMKLFKKCAHKYPCTTCKVRIIPPPPNLCMSCMEWIVQ